MNVNDIKSIKETCAYMTEIYYVLGYITAYAIDDMIYIESTEDELNFACAIINRDDFKYDLQLESAIFEACLYLASNYSNGFYHELNEKATKCFSAYNYGDDYTVKNNTDVIKYKFSNKSIEDGIYSFIYKTKDN